MIKRDSIFLVQFWNYAMKSIVQFSITLTIIRFYLHKSFCIFISFYVCLSCMGVAQPALRLPFLYSFSVLFSHRRFISFFFFHIHRICNVYCNVRNVGWTKTMYTIATQLTMRKLFEDWLYRTYFFWIVFTYVLFFLVLMKLYLVNRIII